MVITLIGAQIFLPKIIEINFATLLDIGARQYTFQALSTGISRKDLYDVLIPCVFTAARVIYATMFQLTVSGSAK